MTKEEIAAVLENHRHWLYEDVDGWETMGANLKSANLTYADLRGARLTYADLRDARLTDANLTYADLRGARLTYADLRRADLRRADLRGARLTDADLTYADLTGARLTDADLRRADLTGARLTDADLTYADLRRADLRRADLTGARLTDADLTYADLRGARLTDADLRGARLSGANFEKTEINYPIACPEEGAFIAWKKAMTMYVGEQQYAEVIIKLLIPEDAKRSSSTTRKCRASKAIVLEGYVLNNPELKLNSDDVICSLYDKRYTYKIGDVLEVLDFDENRWNECAPGIHFFITREEAEEYC